MKVLNMYEFIVPAVEDYKVHYEWDEKVSRLVGGLTILDEAKGAWLDAERNVIKETVIQVKIACEPQFVEKIMDLTAEHYKQQAVMCRHIPGEVYIKEYSNVRT